jgi:ATP-dependent DNA ligase
MSRRRELLDELAPYVTQFDGHPWNWAEHMANLTPAQRRGAGSRWNAGKDLSFVPLRPELVVEARYDYLEGGRFRHTAQFVRWRPDRDPGSCTVDQFERPVTFDVSQLLRTD